MKWIKTSDQLPPKNRPFLAYTSEHEGSFIDVFIWNKTEDIDAFISIGSCDGCAPLSDKDILYWMELPPPPKE